MNETYASLDCAEKPEMLRGLDCIRVVRLSPRSQVGLKRADHPFSDKAVQDRSQCDGWRYFRG